MCTKQALSDPFGCWPPKTERPGEKCSPVGVIWSKSENGGSSKVAERKVPKGWKLSRSRLTTRYRSLIAMRSFAVLQDLLIVHLFAKLKSSCSARSLTPRFGAAACPPSWIASKFRWTDPVLGSHGRPRIQRCAQVFVLVSVLWLPSCVTFCQQHLPTLSAICGLSLENASAVHAGLMYRQNMPNSSKYMLRARTRRAHA